MSNKSSVRLVGHPFAPIGMGEHLRSSFRSFRSTVLKPTIADIYKLNSPADDDQNEFYPFCSDYTAPVNVYCINGNEVEQALKHLSHQEAWEGYNIIYPAWELPKYPKVWADQLDKFDEIWASSSFIYDSLAQACNKPVIKMPLACGISLRRFYGRRFFHIPESDYTFLFYYDLRSYTSRKNPYAVINAFKKLLSSRPYSRTHLVIKINGVDTSPAEYRKLCDALQGLDGDVTCITRVMSGTEVKNLLRCCDCFISLHRSEGYGFGIAEAMAIGKPVIATSYSGNIEFMNDDVAMGVKYNLVPLAEGDYPYFDGQVWAEPDWLEAANYMIELIDCPQKGRDLGAKAQLHMEVNFSYRDIGLNYSNRLGIINKQVI